MIDKQWLIPAYGASPADILLVGEAGGKSEHYAHRPFVGKAGSVLTSYLRAAGLPRPDLRITNLFPAWTGEGNPDPTATQIEAEEWRLVREIERTKPKVIGCLGLLATRWFLGDVTLDTVHGVPLWSERFPGITIVPCYHPAAGFYVPALAALCQDDILRLAYYSRNPPEKLKPPKIKVVYHEEAPEWIEDADVDTEGLPDRPWGMSWSFDGKTAHVWMYAPGKRAPKLRGRITFHNAPHDLKVLRAMKIKTRKLRIGDTMVMAFDTQLEPQGLKALSYRHLGLKMTEFGELVRPHFNKAAVCWLEKAATFDYPPSREEAIEDYAKKTWRIYKPWPTGRRIKSILTSNAKVEAKKLMDLTEEDLKIEQRWKKLSDEHRAQAEDAMDSDFPEFSIFCVPKKEAIRYSGIDDAVTHLNKPKLETILKTQDLTKVYEMDRRAIPFVDRMQEVGMRVDVEKLKVLEADLEDGRDRAHRKVKRVVGDRWFNPGSGDQVAAWLYSLRGFEPLEFTKKGRGSTSDGALQMLRGYHSDDSELIEFIDGVQDYREADKYLGTFIEPIFVTMKRDGRGNWRVHPNFRITRVVSGRLSSFDPNVLAMPTRTTLAKRIRMCFAAEEGYVVISVDLSQIELRMGAHYSRDRTMRQAFIDGRDLHALTGSTIFKVRLEDVSESQRYVAKTTNFATFYGISPRALLEQLFKAGIFDYTLKDCERFIIGWYALYSGVRPWQNRLWDQAEKDGFVKTMFGRICYVPNLRVLDGQLKEAAQRLAGNMPIQGSASDLVKRSEIRLHDHLEKTGLRDVAWPWLQMHDELVLEARKDVADELMKDTERFMLADQDLVSVPLKAKAGKGDSWATAK